MSETTADSTGAGEFSIEITQNRCPLCREPIDLYDYSRTLLQCKNCQKTVHEDCYRVTVEAGEAFRCCGRPDLQPLDQEFIIHSVGGAEGLVKPDPIFDDGQLTIERMW